MPRPLRLAGLVAVLCAAASGRALQAQSGHAWQPGERVLITRFSDVGAVAADLRTVYAASVLGVERYEYVAQRWQAPITALDGYPAGDRPLALVADPMSDVLWLAMAATGLQQLDLTFGRWQRVPLPTVGRIASLVSTPGGLWVYAPPDWLRLAPGSSFPDVVPSGQVPAAVRAQAQPPLQLALQSDRFLASNLAMLGVGAGSRQWPVTSAAPADVPGSWWLGTWGGNLLFFNGHTSESRRLDFGLISPGVSALAVDGRAIWFGGDGRAQLAGVTRGAADLSTWRSWDAHADGAPAGAVRAILPAPEAVWFGAADGLYRLDRASARISHLDEREGLPSSDVQGLAGVRGGLWVGTRAGLAFVDAGGRVEARFLAGTAVHHLVAERDTLWIASDAGLLILPDMSRALAGGAAGAVAAAGAAGAAGAAADSTPRDTLAIQRLAGTGSNAVLAGQVLAARPAVGAVWALAGGGLWRSDPVAGWAPVHDAALTAIGQPLDLGATGSVLWVAGANGVARFDPTAHGWRSYTVGPDLPAGPVQAVLPLGDDVWAATPAGAVRLPQRF